jgi:hypothetical protein
MKLVICTSCKGLKQNQPLTIGKFYKVIESSSPQVLDYLVIDDTGVQRWYNSRMFRDPSDSELREYKLDSILP